MLDVCKGLKAKGHAVILLYVTPGDLLPEYQKICKHILRIHGYSIKKNSPVSYIQFFWDIIKVPVYKNSIVYSNQYHDSLFGSAFSLLRRVPFVCHLRLRPPDPICVQWRLGLKGAKRFIVISNHTKSEWLHRGIPLDKTDLVYNGFDTKQLCPAKNLSLVRKERNRDENEHIISYVGRIDDDKGIETLIEALALLKQKGVILKLLIAGKPLCHPSPADGEKYQKSLSDLSRRLGVDSNVEFLGHVSNPIQLYQMSDLTVLPTTISEAFGRVLAESMACGTPVLASHVGGIPEVLSGEFKMCLFEPGDSQDLAKKITSYMDWRKNDPELGQRCRRHIEENFNLKKMIAGVEAAFQKTVLK